MVNTIFSQSEKLSREKIDAYKKLYLTDKLKFDGYSEEDVAGFEKVDYKKLAETAINYSDAVIKGSTELDEDLLKLIEDSKLPTLEYADGEYKEQYKPFYETLFEE